MTLSGNSLKYQDKNFKINLIRDRKKRDYRIRIILIQIKFFEILGPGHALRAYMHIHLRNTRPNILFVKNTYLGGLQFFHPVFSNGQLAFQRCDFMLHWHHHWPELFCILLSLGEQLWPWQFCFYTKKIYIYIFLMDPKQSMDNPSQTTTWCKCGHPHLSHCKKVCLNKCFSNN